jgi:hypothetical protein
MLAVQLAAIGTKRWQYLQAQKHVHVSGVGNRGSSWPGLGYPGFSDVPDVSLDELDWVNGRLARYKNDWIMMSFKGARAKMWLYHKQYWSRNLLLNFVSLQIECGFSHRIFALF